MTSIFIYSGNLKIGSAEMIEFKELNKNPRGWCGRVRFDKSKIRNIFSNAVISSKSQRLPFNIDFYDGILENVWIESINTVYIVGNYIIVDVVDWIAESLK